METTLGIIIIVQNGNGNFGKENFQSIIGTENVQKITKLKKGFVLVMAEFQEKEDIRNITS